MSPSSSDIRRFLMDTFSDEELETFCFDYFQECHSSFAQGMSKSVKVRRLIEYCQRRDLTANLLEAIKAERPQQYDPYFGKASLVNQVSDTVTKLKELERLLDGSRYVFNEQRKRVRRLHSLLAACRREPIPANSDTW